VYVVRSNQAIASLQDFASTTQQNLPIHACKRLGCRFSYLKQQIFWSWVHWVGLSASRDSVFHALHLAEQYDVKILLDVNWRPVFWPNPDTARQTIQQLFKQIDFLKLSKKKQNGYLKPLIRGDYLSPRLSRRVVVAAGDMAVPTACLKTKADYLLSQSPS